MSEKSLRRLAWAALIAAALAGAFFLGRGSVTTTAPSSAGEEILAERPAEETATVIAVTDGDTVRVRLSDGREDKVRYIGIDTPEMNQPFGEEARAANQALVAGREVRLVRDASERDRYGRLLRYVYVGDLFVNAELVRAGYAHAVDYPPDITFSGCFASLEREAEAAGAGLWATP